MREELLHFVWEYQYFRKNGLQTVCGKSIEIRNPGNYNIRDAGPDFAEAEVVINGIKWLGQVEIHVKASDWLKHGHQENPAYDNVILHVVFQHDTEIMDREGNVIPALELKELIPAEILETADYLQTHSDPIPCRSLIHTVPKIKIHQWLDRLAVERLEEKCEFVYDRLKENKGDWEATYIDVLCNYMGFKVNNAAFLMLSQKIDWKWMQKNAGDLKRLQAYLYGLAGFLRTDADESYERDLMIEFQHLKRMYKLQPLPVVIWKFSRMRPANYPSMRLAHIAALFHRHVQLLPAMLFCKSIDDFYSYFDVEYPDYWKEHYAFSRESKTKRDFPGKMSIQLLLINVATPVLYAYGKYVKKDVYCDRAISLWQALPAEQNRITRLWKDTKVKPQNAWDTQALIRLYKEYCSSKKCLDCQIGRAILREAAKEYGVLASRQLMRSID